MDKDTTNKKFSSIEDEILQNILHSFGIVISDGFNSKKLQKKIKELIENDNRILELNSSDIVTLIISTKDTEYIKSIIEDKEKLEYFDIDCYLI